MPLWPASPGSAHEAPTTQRDQFASDELTSVLSHYPLGTVDSTQEFARGSRRSPKIVITTTAGKFLLKRRARGKNDPQRVTFNHAIQLHLAHKHFPLPRLVATTDHQSFLKYQDNIYELFEFISASHYPGTLEATETSGQTLATYHQLLLDFSSDWYPSAASYHRARTVQQSFIRIESAQTVSITLLAELRKLYNASSDIAEHAGMASWPTRIVHADWHPGNLLFDGDRVVAVLDYDSARRLPIAIDLANGALQFSMINGDDDAGKWPDETDQARYRKFLRGYHSINAFSAAEAQAIPPLMIEALIAEAVFPIALTGMFGRIHGEIFLHMVQRKARWIADHADALTSLAEGK
jgi:Ser/Thr protein kinase RdoA (MazF antagonist)